MKAKLFTDEFEFIPSAKSKDGAPHGDWYYIDQQINDFVKGNEVKILETHFSTAATPDGDTINSALVYYEGKEGFKNTSVEDTGGVGQNGAKTNC